jgi:hypothetical protein
MVNAAAVDAGSSSAGPAGGDPDELVGATAVVDAGAASAGPAPPTIEAVQPTTAAMTSHRGEHLYSRGENLALILTIHVGRSCIEYQRAIDS